jgi:FK506-binding nuclear protein
MHGSKGNTRRVRISAETKTKVPVETKVVCGVTIADIKVGTGDWAKKGRKLMISYIGKLENGIVFDTKTTGNPCASFYLGKGEVIQGWEVGLLGMRVGGERRLTIPAPLAYGASKGVPGIPPNSNLIYDGKNFGTR